MNVVICSAQEQGAVEAGIPAVHSLGMAEPPPLQTWVHRAEYRLPEGYVIGKNRWGQLGVYNQQGHHCPIIDSAYCGGRGGTPILVDNDLPDGKRIISPIKLYDRTLELLRGGRWRKK